MMGTIKRGAFIVLEGCDRAGKSTQCQKLIESLLSQGQKVETINFPDRTTSTGTLISQYLGGKTKLNDKTIHLLFSANRWEAESKILSKLNEGTTIICDRYAYSGVAYSSAKGLDFYWCKQPDVGLPKPDLVLFLDMPTNVQESRNGFGEEIYEKKLFQQLVRNQFLKLKEDYWQIIDASRPIEDVYSELIKYVEKVTKLPRGGVEKLWTKML